MQHPYSQYKLYALPIYSQKAQLMLVFHLNSFPIRYLNALRSLWHLQVAAGSPGIN